ncbi:MAG: type II secretion system protein GspN [Deltaproteobacteria bacterium]|nr:type II secretion system protein GspN [Deltaproteobacteria bacterium]
MRRRENRSTLKTSVIAAALIIPGLFLLCVVAFYLVPDELIEGWLKEAAARKAGVAFTRKSFSKAFPFGIELRAVEIAGNGGTRLLLLDRVRARVNPLSLFAGRLTAYIDGDAGDGGFTGYAILRPSGVAVATEAKGVDLRYLPVLTRSSVKINGLLDARVSLNRVGAGCLEGTISINGFRIESGEVMVMGFPLPLGSIESAGGQVELKGCKALIEGLWIEGKDLSARLKGEITAIKTPLAQSPVELTLEIIPKHGLVNKEFMLSLLSDFRKSANFYSIPVRGTIGAPVFVR